jgi:hypothetical protein
MNERTGDMGAIPDECVVGARIQTKAELRELPKRLKIRFPMQAGVESRHVTGRPVSMDLRRGRALRLYRSPSGIT